MRCVFPAANGQESPTHANGHPPLTVTPVSSSKSSTPKSPKPFKAHRFPSPSAVFRKSQGHSNAVDTQNDAQSAQTVQPRENALPIGDKGIPNFIKRLSFTTKETLLRPDPSEKSELSHGVSNKSNVANASNDTSSLKWISILTSTAVDEILSKECASLPQSPEIVGWPGGLLPSHENSAPADNQPKLNPLLPLHPARIKNKRFILNIILDWYPTLSSKPSSKVEQVVSTVEELLFKLDGKVKEYPDKDSLFGSLFQVLKSVAAPLIPDFPAELSVTKDGILSGNPSLSFLDEPNKPSKTGNGTLSLQKNRESTANGKKEELISESFATMTNHASAFSPVTNQSESRSSSPFQSAPVQISEPSSMEGSFLSFGKARKNSNSVSRFSFSNPGDLEDDLKRSHSSTEKPSLTQPSPVTNNWETKSNNLTISSSPSFLNSVHTPLQASAVEASTSAHNQYSSSNKNTQRGASSSLSISVDKSMSSHVVNDLLESPNFKTEEFDVKDDSPNLISTPIEHGKYRSKNTNPSVAKIPNMSSSEAANWAMWEAILSGTAESMEKALKEHGSTCQVPVLSRALKMVSKWKKDKKARMEDAMNELEVAKTSNDPAKLENAKAVLIKREEEYAKMENLSRLTDALQASMENEGHFKRGRPLTPRERKKKIQEDIKRAKENMKSAAMAATIIEERKEENEEEKEKAKEHFDFVKNAWKSLDLDDARKCIANREKMTKMDRGKETIESSTLPSIKMTGVTPSDLSNKNQLPPPVAMLSSNEITTDESIPLNGKVVRSNLSVVDLKGKGIVTEKERGESEDIRDRDFATQDSKIGEVDADQTPLPLISTNQLALANDSFSSLPDNLLLHDLISFKSFDQSTDLDSLVPENSRVNPPNAAQSDDVKNEKKKSDNRTTGEKDERLEDELVGPHDDSSFDALNPCNANFHLRRSRWIYCGNPPPSPNTSRKFPSTSPPKSRMLSSRSVSSTPLHKSADGGSHALSASASSLLISSMPSSKHSNARSKLNPASKSTPLPSNSPFFSLLPTTSSSSSKPSALLPSSFLASASSASASTSTTAPPRSSSPSIAKSSIKLSKPNSTPTIQSSPSPKPEIRSKNGVTHSKKPKPSELNSNNRNSAPSESSSRLGQTGKVKVDKPTSTLSSQCSDLASDATSKFLHNQRAVNRSSASPFRNSSPLGRNAGDDSRMKSPSNDPNHAPHDQISMNSVNTSMVTAKHGHGLGSDSSVKEQTSRGKHPESLLSVPHDSAVRASKTKVLKKSSVGTVTATTTAGEKKVPNGENGSKEEIHSDQLCCVCMSSHKKAAFIPCGHTFCRNCAREINKERGKCPLCNRRIRDVLKLY